MDTQSLKGLSEVLMGYLSNRTSVPPAPGKCTVSLLRLLTEKQKYTKLAVLMSEKLTSFLHTAALSYQSYASAFYLCAWQKERDPSVKRIISADQDQQQGTRKETVSSETTQQESQTSPLKQIGRPVSYCPISQIHSAGEIAGNREECKKESFWCRGASKTVLQPASVASYSKGRQCHHTCKECEVKLGSNEKEGSNPSAS
ncbi:uncharacterized protein ACIB01_010043 [Guaruba guarouba]